MVQNSMSRMNDSMIGAKHHSGFTLIELLVVAAVFSFTSLLATTVFSNIQSSQRVIQGQQRVTTDGRFIIETIARSVRTNTINYVPYTNGVTSTSETILSSTDQNGVITCYRRDATAKQVQVLSPAPANCVAAVPTDWVSFTPDDLNVDTLIFYIRPISDPFRPVPRSAVDCKQSTPIDDGNIPPTITDGFDQSLGACVCQPANAADCFSGLCTTPTGSTRTICTNPNVQPQVTIFMKTSSKNAGPGEKANITLQTTVVSRLYQK